MMTAYVMIFGWPTSLVIGARQKICLVTLASVLLGLCLSRTQLFRWLAINVILGLLWISWPVIVQGRLDAVFSALPIAFGLWACHQVLSTEEKAARPGMLLTVIGIGLSIIALHARTVSYSQLSLALASSLLVICLYAPRSLTPIPIVAAATMLSGLLGALILYGETSLPAILVLCSCLASSMLARLYCSTFTVQRRYWTDILIAIVLMMAAIFIAWIDAGAVSVYEGVQRDGVVFQRFALAGDDGHDWEDS